jgi:hypothetical protein
MPSKSEAQRRKMAILHEEGKITDEEWQHFKKIKKTKKKKKSK